MTKTKEISMPTVTAFIFISVNEQSKKKNMENTERKKKKKSFCSDIFIHTKKSLLSNQFLFMIFFFL